MVLSIEDVPVNVPQTFVNILRVVNILISPLLTNAVITERLVYGRQPPYQEKLIALMTYNDIFRDFISRTVYALRISAYFLHDRISVDTVI